MYLLTISFAQIGLTLANLNGSR